MESYYLFNKIMKTNYVVYRNINYLHIIVCDYKFKIKD